MTSYPPPRQQIHKPQHYSPNCNACSTHQCLLYSISQSDNKPLLTHLCIHLTSLMTQQNNIISQCRCSSPPMASNHIIELGHALHKTTSNAADNQSNNSKIPNKLKEYSIPSQIIAHATYSPTSNSILYHIYHLLPPMDNLYPYAERLCTSLVQAPIHSTRPTYCIADPPLHLQTTTVLLSTTGTSTTLTTITNHLLIRPFILRTTSGPPIQPTNNQVWVFCILAMQLLVVIL